jgi:hypothetical protein
MLSWEDEMLLMARETGRVLASAQALTLTSPIERVESFISRLLGFNAIQQAQHFPSPDPGGLLAIAVANLTGAREAMLRDECVVPTFVVYEDALHVPQIAGLSTYVNARGYDVEFQRRLAQHGQIRTALRSLERGQHLEALAAAIMNEHCDRGEATQASGDQGIDAIGWKELMTIDPVFSDGSVSTPQVSPGEKVFLLASSKAVAASGRGKPRLLEIAHVRELVGGWVIQRSPAGKWKEFGLQTLSPIQMILVTTYRMSIEAKSLCRILGVQIWGIPELIYLICKLAPDPVFDRPSGSTFSATAFRAWWKDRDRNRLIAA